MNKHQNYQPIDYWTSLLHNHPNLKGVGWPDLSLAFNQWQYLARASSVRRSIPNANGMRVLDIGSGTGFWIDFWKKSGAAFVAGLDIVPSAIEKLRKQFPDCRFEQADIADNIPYDGPFDIISAIDVLLHITSEEAYDRALFNLRKVANKDSRLVLLEPITNGPPISYIPGSNSRARSINRLRSGLESAGWKVSLIYPALWMLSMPIEAEPNFLCSFLRFHWRLEYRLARYELTGKLYGSILYPLDRLLCRIFHWGPTAKIVIAEAE